MKVRGISFFERPVPRLILSREAGEGDRRQAVEGAAARTMLAITAAGRASTSSIENRITLTPCSASQCVRRSS